MRAERSSKSVALDSQLCRTCRRGCIDVLDVFDVFDVFDAFDDDEKKFCFVFNQIIFLAIPELSS